MTQGDIHNRSRTLERIQNQIETSPDISERDKKLLLDGTSDFPGFLTFLQNDDTTGEDSGYSGFSSYNSITCFRYLYCIVSDFVMG